MDSASRPGRPCQLYLRVGSDRAVALRAGLIAEQAFGFSGQLGEGVNRAGAQAGDAAALSSSLLVCLVVPWSLCLLFYFGAP